MNCSIGVAGTGAAFSAAGLCFRRSGDAAACAGHGANGVRSGGSNACRTPGERTAGEVGRELPPALIGWRSITRSGSPGKRATVHVLATSCARS